MLSAKDIQQCKGKRLISMVTCYDYASALILTETKVDIVLIGDSLGEIIYGFPNTTHVTMKHMIEHTKAVRQGIPNKHIISDMPYKSYDTPQKALDNAKALIEAGANSVKLEIPSSKVVEILINYDIPVLGHVGLTPQTIHDYKKQGKNEASALRIYNEALELEKAGCFGILLEAIPSSLAYKISKQAKIPTIGIAAGKCDGQVLVWHDLLGYLNEKRPYVTSYANLFPIIKNALDEYAKHITKGE